MQILHWFQGGGYSINLGRRITPACPEHRRAWEITKNNWTHRGVNNFQEAIIMKAAVETATIETKVAYYPTCTSMRVWLARNHVSKVTEGGLWFDGLPHRDRFLVMSTHACTQCRLSEGS